MIAFTAMAADISDNSAEKINVNFPRKTSGSYGGRRDSKVWRVRTTSDSSRSRVLERNDEAKYSSKTLQASERSSQAQVEELFLSSGRKLRAQRPPLHS